MTAIAVQCWWIMQPPRHWLFFLSLALALAVQCFVSTSQAKTLVWEPLDSYPDPIGVAAPVAGVVDGALLVGGGANFPDRPPWEGGTKVWQDRLWRLESPTSQWQNAGRLPRPIGYAVCVNHRDSMICVGGSDAERHYADVFRIRWRSGRAKFETLPRLPSPAANACGAVIGDVLYVAGGTSAPTSTSALASFYALDLAAPRRLGNCYRHGLGRRVCSASRPSWKRASFSLAARRLPPTSRANHNAPTWPTPIAFARQTTPGRPSPRHRARRRGPVSTPAIGPSHFVVLGGDDGSRVDHEPKSSHPGFPGPLLAYHTITNTWAEMGEVQHCA